jgi:hypothetical protein
VTSLQAPEPSPETGVEGARLAYERGAALAGVGRIDEAVAAFDRAELLFTQTDDDVDRATAIWGRAHALAGSGRCSEARRAYGEYRVLVRPRDPTAAEMATRHAAACTESVHLR